MRQFVRQFLHFGLKQAYACLFGGTLLFLILVTKFFWPAEWPVARYDFLFVMAFVVQALFLAFKLETIEEMKVIFLFHLVGTVMEIFKTHVGSWEYPNHNLLRIGGVPLFCGFMYSAVGSYIARIWRIFDQRFTHYPPKIWTVVLCVLIYANFFTHHYTYDIRYILLAFTLVLYGRTWVIFRPHDRDFKMPLLLGFLLVSFFIWIAENVGTYCSIWHYPNQRAAWQMVSIEKMGSWFLLMIISFVLVSLLHDMKKERQEAR